ncbi:unnamed protein product, partial [Musa acuminata subsp. burmannicoides]
VKQNIDACAYIMTISKRIWERITWCKCKTCVRRWGKAQKRRSIPQPSSPSESPQTNEWATAWRHLNLLKSLLRWPARIQEQHLLVMDKMLQIIFL